jgi:hypothetical protein
MSEPCTECKRHNEEHPEKPWVCYMGGISREQELVTLLKRIEWAGWGVNEDRYAATMQRCPNCKNKHPNHSGNCELARLIR